MESFWGSGEAIRLILLGCSLAFLPLGGQLLDISGEGLQAHTPSPTSGSEQTVTQLPGRASNHAGSCGNISPSSLKGLSISGYCEHSKGTAGAGAMGFRDYPRKCLELRGLHGASLVAQMVESACSSLGSIPRLGSSPGGGHGNPLQYSCLENPMDRRTWPATVHGVVKSWT